MNPIMRSAPASAACTRSCGPALAPHSQSSMLGWALACALGLGACGGGSGEGMDAATLQGKSADSTAQITNLAEYSATHRPLAIGALGPAPSAAEQAAIFELSRSRAVARLQAAGAIRNLSQSNLTVVPPLMQSYVDLLASAARGQTLAELRALYPAAPSPAVAAALTQGVQRQLWSVRGVGLATGFLSGTDMLGPWPALASWRGQELASWADPALRAGLAQLQPSLGSLSVYNPSTTRLVVADGYSERTTWPVSETLAGVFETGYGRQVVALQRLSVSARRFDSAAYVAHAATVGGRTLLTLQPRAGSFRSFLTSGLDAALSEAVNTLTRPGAPGWGPGEMLLPVTESSDPGFVSMTSGLNLATNEINADLRGLDGGGSFAQPRDTSTQLALTSHGLTLQSAHTTAFVYSPKNLFGGGTAGTGSGPSGVVGSSVGDGFKPACPRSTPDLRNFALVVLNDQRRVTSLSAISYLSGDACQ